MTNSGKQQIKESLKQVAKLHPDVSKVTLVIAKDFTLGEIRWWRFSNINAGSLWIYLIEFLWSGRGPLAQIYRKFLSNLRTMSYQVQL